MSFSNLAQTRVMVGETEIQSFHIPVTETSPRQPKQQQVTRAPETPPPQTNTLNVQMTAQPASASKYQVPQSVAAPPSYVVVHENHRPSAIFIPSSPMALHHARNASSPHFGGPNHVRRDSSPHDNSPVVRANPRPSINIVRQPETSSPSPMLGMPSPPVRTSPSPASLALRPTPTSQRPSIISPASNMMSPTMTSPAAATSASSPPPPGPPAPPTDGGRPQLMRTASMKQMAQAIGITAPVIKRMASVDENKLAVVQKAREDAKPDVTKAERYRNLTCPRVRDASKGTYTLNDIWKFTDREFLQYGLGVMLWFKLTRRLSYLFLFLFILNIPSLVFNIVGPDASSLPVSDTVSNSSVADPLESEADGTYGLSYTTLANQGLVVNATIFGYSKQVVGLVTGSLDTLATVIFIIAVFFIFRDHKKEAVKYNSTVMTVRRFTVLVTELPDTTPVLDRIDIADFFQKAFGPVVDVSIAYNDMPIIQLFKERGEMKREIQSLEMQGHMEDRDALAEKLAVHDKMIIFRRKLYKRKIRAAFITFQYQESVSKCLAAYPRSWWTRCLMLNHLRFHGAALKVTRAAEPSNTLFHNLGLAQSDLWCRRAWTGLLSLVLMSVSFAAVFVSQYYQNRIPTTSTCAATAITSVAQVVDETTLFCYCAGLSTHELYNNSSYCASYITQYAISKGLIFLTALSTVLVNFLLQVFMDRLSVLERHSSLTSQQRGITSRLFWGLFFNTGVIIVIVNANLSPYFTGSFSVFKSVLPGSFYELTVDWYYEVGVSILITMFLNSMNPHLLSLMAIPYDSCRRKHCANSKKNQNELNKLYQGRTFVLYERYSVLLNTTFVCMMFSAGMPILWLVAAVTFALTYWFDKTTFLRNYRIPPRYDESLDLYAGKMMPYAVVPHLLLALWFFTSPMTYSFALSELIPIMTASESGVVRTQIYNIRERFFQWNSFPTLVLLLALFAIVVARRVLELIFFCRASEAEQRAARLGIEEMKSKSRVVTYQEAAAKIGLESYRLSRQQDYRIAYMATESRKQMPQDVDLQVLRARAADDLAVKKKGGKAGKKGAEKNKAAVPLKKDSAQVVPEGALSPPGRATEAWGHSSSPSINGVASETEQPGSASMTREDRSKSLNSADSVGSADEIFRGGAHPSMIMPDGPAGPSDSNKPPVAALSNMTDEATLTMAAAVTSSSPESLDYALLPISCPGCGNIYQIVDCGEAMSYTCPFCQAQTII